MTKISDTAPTHRNERYINREYSWLQFNHRVLAEAARETNPLLERVKFLSIFESNLDEFFMVRVSGLIEQEAADVLNQTPEGMTPHEQLVMVAQAVRPMRAEASKLWSKSLQPALAESGISIKRVEELSRSKQEKLLSYFREEVFHVCTPLAMAPSHSFPFISNRSLNLAVELADPSGVSRIARVKVPNILPRLIPTGARLSEFVWLEDLIQAHLEFFFPGIDILGAHRFRVIRDADFEIRELEAADLVTTVEQTLHMRRFGDPVALEIEATAPKRVRQVLQQNLQLDDQDVYEVEGLIGMDGLWELVKLDRPSLKFKPHHPYIRESLLENKNLFSTLTKQDLILHHPFDSFETMEAFVSSAAKDPDVLGIKMTMYRVGSESPVVESLLDAAAAGKQVAAIVELKARFDESNNLVWSRALERAGVHVSYGFPEMKVHSKLCLIVRREKTGIQTYGFVGTGNFNPQTARMYTDLGLLTSDPDITQDIAELFNYLTGFSQQTSFRKLVVAPLNLREAILERIQREIEVCEKKKKGHIIFKLNSLVDPEVIDALYRASAVGVTIDLIVRGICCLRPGVKGLSEKIRVISVVGRFLEHSRVYYFENGGAPEALLGSADLMRRNLDRRIETLVPVTEPRLMKYLRGTVLESYLKDNTNAWVEDGDGHYQRIKRPSTTPVFASQDELMKWPAVRVLLSS
ncbi:MAG TPA: polyphosphate kinase 1 [Fimbriimonadaceae bacterium]|nr:polyphosphate kinase 1 [Fimbriimonadaceae bacterium]HRJ33656.1 polyphosphate kinase 1 [Fimbriimonadaceae bacterium]